jgi:hypothetical protein
MAYWAGMGVTQDSIEAYLWATMSASQRNEEAKELQAAIQKEMTPAQWSKAKRLAQAWKARMQGPQKLKLLHERP